MNLTNLLYKTVFACLLIVQYAALTAQVTWDHADLNALTSRNISIATPCLPQNPISVKLWAQLDMGEDYDLGANGHDVQVQLRIVTSSNGSNIAQFTPILTSKDISPESRFEFDLTGVYNNITDIDIDILSYTNNGPTFYQPHIRLEADLEQEMGTQVTNATVVSSPTVSYLSNGVVTIPALSPTQLTFSWGTPCNLIPNYQVEIVRLFNRSPNPNTEEEIQADVNWSEALVLETDGPQTNVKVTLTEGQGYYAWRVRPIGSWFANGIAHALNYGGWVGANLSQLNIQAASQAPTGVFFYNQFDQDINWIHSRVFTEGGRIKEQMTYANGLQQAEQSQVYLPSTENTLVTQSVYDYAGRAALQSMPAPNGQPYLKYTSNVLQGTSGKYRSSDFDKDANYNSPTPATGLISSYYNGLSTEEIPDAEGYVYSRSLFYGDGTSRVREASGVGSTHMINSIAEKHTTRVYYSGVSNVELIRILGDEAPSSQATQKVITLDPNNTATVSYVDKAGQTIATCLSSGDNGSTDLLEGLPSRADAAFSVIDTVTRQRVDGNLIRSGKTIALTEPTNVILGLELTPQKIEDLCTNICQWCDYNIYYVIRRTDDPDPNACSTCGEIRPAILQNIGGFDCNTALTLTVPDESVLLPAGSYFIERVVETNNPNPNDAPFTYSESFLNAVEAALDLQADVVLQPLYTFIDNGDLDGFNSHLGLNNLVNGDHWDLQITNCCSIEIPFEDCENLDCSTLDFEDMLVQRWAGTPYEPALGNSFGNYIPGTSPYSNSAYGFNSTGKFNAVIGQMLNNAFVPNDPNLQYDCEKLYACWRGIVESYGQAVDAMASIPTQYGGPQLFDPIEAFLSCAGYRIVGFQNPNSSSTEWTTHPYAYFPYVSGTNTACEAALASSQGLSSVDFNAFTLDDWAAFYYCINTPSTSSGPVSQGTIAQTAQDMEDACVENCEARRDAYLQMVINAFEGMSQTVQGQWDANTGTYYTSTNADVLLSEIYCYADGLVRECENICASFAATATEYDPDGNPVNWEFTYDDRLECWLTGQLALRFSDNCNQDESSVGGGSSYEEALPHYLNAELRNQLYSATLWNTTWDTDPAIDGFMGISGGQVIVSSVVPVIPNEISYFEVDDCELLYQRKGALIQSGGFYELDGDYTEITFTKIFNNVTGNQVVPFPGSWTNGNPTGSADQGLVGAVNATLLTFTPPNGNFSGTVTFTFTGNSSTQIVATNVCGNISCGKMCVECSPITMDDPHVFEPITCEDATLANLENLIAQQLTSCIDGHLASMEDEYQTSCVDGYTDVFTISYPLNYHHYTLYYQDRAGNLTRTVPPHGVDLSSTTRNQHPSHQYETRYKYNSLGQLVWQQTPDGGTTEFWYDDIGRLRFSQNAEQAARTVPAYSYTRYDYLGRVTEVGESDEDPTNIAAYVNVNTFPGQTSQETFTVYTSPAGVTSLSGQQQRFLENNVSYVYTGDGAYTFFSYDPHGNVDWMIQRVPGLGDKEISYEYDLISGNVLQVNYQKGQLDEFYHRYAYDEDNRLILAETSEDGSIWEKDGRYEYYTHGPLRKLTYGEDKVQGCDHVYTLQGWLKGLNHPSLDQSKDPSQDGLGTSNVARDTWGMILGYFDGDFRKNGSEYNSDVAFTAHDHNLSPTNHSGAYEGLYNGNISSWTWRWNDFRPGGMNNVVDAANIHYSGTRGYVYRYDELNRIASGDHYKYNGAGAYVASGEFGTGYDYDAAGNLMHLDRDAYNQGSGKEMDRLQYWYYYGTGTNVYRYDPGTHLYHFNGGTSANPPAGATNKLAYVTDSEGQTHATDLASQSNADNYRYNEIGELVEDQAEGFTTDWNVYHKVDKVQWTSNPSYTEIDFGYGPMQNRISKKVIAANGDESTTFYVRDASGNVMSVYRKSQNGNYTVTKQTELPIYGSDRLGQQQRNLDMSQVYDDGGSGTGGSTQRGLLILSEVLYDSPGNGNVGEYFTLENVSDQSLDLSGIEFSTGESSNYAVPAGTSLSPGEYLLVSWGTSVDESVFLSLANLDAILNTEVQWLWQRDLGLSDAGATLTLSDAAGLLIDEVAYGEELIEASNVYCDEACQGSYNRPPVQVLQRLSHGVIAGVNYDLDQWGTAEATGLGVKSNKPKVAHRDLDGKVYELKDHLGNVRAVISDFKLSEMNGSTPGVFLADVKELKDYYAFGMLMPGQVGEPAGADGYRYGFNGMERDEELKGQGGSYDFGARIYDPRVGRWGSVDAGFMYYEDMSPYSGIGNNPLILVDPDGNYLHLSFDSKEAYDAFVKLVNSTLEGQFEVDFGLRTKDRLGYNFSVKLIPVKGKGDVGKLSEKGKAFYEELNKVLTAKEVVRQKVFYNLKDIQSSPTDKEVTFMGSFQLSTLDMYDIEKLDAAGARGYSSAGVLIHEVIEQWEKRKLGLDPGEMGDPRKTFFPSHEVAKLSEDKVNGSTQVEGEDGSKKTIEKDGSEIGIEITGNPDGKTLNLKKTKIK